MKETINYHIKKGFIEKKEIILTNNSDFERLCRVVINQKLFKIVYIASKSEETIEYPDETIKCIEVSDI